MATRRLRSLAHHVATATDAVADEPELSSPRGIFPPPLDHPPPPPPHPTQPPGGTIGFCRCCSAPFSPPPSLTGARWGRAPRGGADGAAQGDRPAPDGRPPIRAAAGGPRRRHLCRRRQLPRGGGRLQDHLRQAHRAGGRGGGPGDRGDLQCLPARPVYRLPGAVHVPFARLRGTPARCRAPPTTLHFHRAPRPRPAPAARS